MSDNPALAKHIKVTREPGHKSFQVEVDGKTFPWFVAADDGVKVSMSTERTSAVTVTILAEHVELVDRVMADGAADDVMAGHFHDEQAQP